MLDKIKKYYDKGFYKKAHIAALVQSGKISIEQYTDIVNEAFPIGISTEKLPTTTEITIKNIQNNNEAINAKIQALTASNEFLEECLVEIAEIVYA